MSERQFKVGPHLLSLSEVEDYIKKLCHNPTDQALYLELIDEIKSLRSARSDEVIIDKTAFEESFNFRYKISAVEAITKHTEFKELDWATDSFIDGGARVGRVFTIFEDRKAAEYCRERLKVLGLPYTSNWPKDSDDVPAQFDEPLFSFYVSANLDQIQKFDIYKEFNWEQSYSSSSVAGMRNSVAGLRNLVKTRLDTKEAGEALITRLKSADLTWFRNWVN